MSSKPGSFIVKLKRKLLSWKLELKRLERERGKPLLQRLVARPLLGQVTPKLKTLMERQQLELGSSERKRLLAQQLLGRGSPKLKKLIARQLLELGKPKLERLARG